MGEKNEVDQVFYNRKRRAKSIAIALILGGLVILFYVVTLVKFNPS